jgi:hypothetical protein
VPPVREAHDYRIVVSDLEKHRPIWFGGNDRTFIKGQKCVMLSHPQNHKGPARKNLKLLLVANKRLNAACLLKESFGKRWDYNGAGP